MNFLVLNKPQHRVLNLRCRIIMEDIWYSKGMETTEKKGRREAKKKSKMNLHVLSSSRSCISKLAIFVPSVSHPSNSENVKMRASANKRVFSRFFCVK